jgi:hypothetical protein
MIDAVTLLLSALPRRSRRDDHRQTSDEVVGSAGEPVGEVLLDLRAFLGVGIAALLHEGSGPWPDMISEHGPA